MALAMVVLMIVGTEVVIQRTLIERRRQREEETIWRGRQYVRAIRLYYQKTGHYPQNLEDLQKGLPELHFLRSVAYKDPMNRQEGEWRMIYVNPAGQIIGSVRYATLQQMAILELNGGHLPTAPDSSITAFAATTGPPPATTGGSQAGPASQPGAGGPGTAAQPGASAFTLGMPGAAPDSSAGAAPSPNPAQALFPGQNLAALAQLKPTGPVDGPVIGAFLTGVASKVDADSLKVYHGGKKYIEWEFIWNPYEDQARALQQGLAPQAPQPGQPGVPIGPGGIGIGQPGATAPLGGAIVQPQPLGGQTLQ